MRDSHLYVAGPCPMIINTVCGWWATFGIVPTRRLKSCNAGRMSTVASRRVATCNAKSKAPLMKCVGKTCEQENRSDGIHLNYHGPLPRMASWRLSTADQI